MKLENLRNIRVGELNSERRPICLVDTTNGRIIRKFSNETVEEAEKTLEKYSEGFAFRSSTLALIIQTNTLKCSRVSTPIRYE